MLKIRMQGTLKDIRWFKGLMERHGEIKVKDVSKPFKNKGTDQYVRVYASNPFVPMGTKVVMNGVEYTVEDSVKKDRYFNAYLIMGTKDGKAEFHLEFPKGKSKRE